MPADLFRNVFILTGPTGSGKSEFALDLAERLGAEIVGMDSMTLYRGLDVGTAKPSRAERQRIPHHLIDVLEPWESASVAWWLGRAADCSRQIAARGRRVLFVGGTPLYLKAVLHGLFDGPPADAELRQRLETDVQTLGPVALHQKLAAVDPASAGRLHPNDSRRIIRALEVWELTGRPLSAWQQEWRRPPQALNCWWIDRPRPELYARINARVWRMLDAGWLDEARALRQASKPLSREAGQALGYAELFAHLDGRATLTETAMRIQTRSRQFAKRQLTWFRGLPECRRISVSGSAIPDFARNADEA